MRERDFFLDIHLVARTYHWTESEILALSIPRRQAYLDLILESEILDLVPEA